MAQGTYTTRNFLLNCTEEGTKFIGSATIRAAGKLMIILWLILYVHGVYSTIFGYISIDATFPPLCWCSVMELTATCHLKKWLNLETRVIRTSLFWCLLPRLALRKVQLNLLVFLLTITLRSQLQLGRALLQKMILVFSDSIVLFELTVVNNTKHHFTAASLRKQDHFVARPSRFCFIC